MRGRVRLLLAALLTVLVVFAGRLIYLQLLHAPVYRELSRANAVQPLHVPPLRGRILARDGTVLAGNRVAVDLLYRGGEVARWPRLAYLLGLKGPPTPPDPAEAHRVLAWNLPDEIVPAVAELIAGQPNLSLRERLERTYPTQLAAHVVGYTAEADPARFSGYRRGDLVGQMGLEQHLQEALFGTPGAALLEVDRRMDPLGRTVTVGARPGQDVVLTLDVRAQHAAEEVLRGALKYVNADRARQGLPEAGTVGGALIAMNPQTGEILAMASAPSFDPNLFARRPTPAGAIAALFGDDATPLYNRAVSAYPPASTFKVVSSSALLEGGFIGPETRFHCSPSFSFGGTFMRNWSAEDKGLYTAEEALADSCNTFYWRAVAQTPGVKTGWGAFAAALAARAQELGYGTRVGVGLPEEQPGRVPTDAWARDFYGHAWYPGYTMNMVIGQGDVLATPLQVLQLAATVATGGEQVQPHLVRRIGGVPTEVSVRRVPGAHWEPLQAGMRRLMTDYGGRWLLGPEVFPVAVAGKTGTAQNPQGADHAWFMGFGPLDDPELAVVVFIQHGGSSSAVALPTARDFMKRYWTDIGRLD